MDDPARPGDLTGIAAAIGLLLSVVLLGAAVLITFTTGLSSALGARSEPLTVPIVLAAVGLAVGVLALLAGLISAVMAEGRSLGLLWAGLAVVPCSGSALLLLLPSLLASQR